MCFLLLNSFMIQTQMIVTVCFYCVHMHSNIFHLKPQEVHIYLFWNDGSFHMLFYWCNVEIKIWVVHLKPQVSLSFELTPTVIPLSESRWSDAHTLIRISCSGIDLPSPTVSYVSAAKLRDAAGWGAKQTDATAEALWPRPLANAPPPPICPRVPLKRFSRMQGLPTDTDGNMATEVKLAHLCFILCFILPSFRMAA